MTDDEFSDAIKQLDLRAELAEMKKKLAEARGLYLQRNYHREQLERELVAMRQQRDEARRRVCELSLIKKLVYRKLDGVDGRFIECKTPEEVAQVCGWDCFAEKEGGGA